MEKALLDSICRQLSRVLETKSSNLADFKEATQNVVKQVKDYQSENEKVITTSKLSDSEFDKLLNEVSSPKSKENESKNENDGLTSLMDKIENVSKIFSMFMNDVSDITVTDDQNHTLLFVPYDKMLEMENGDGYAEGWNCDRCAMNQKAGRGSYHCGECEFDLCRACYALEKEVKQAKIAAKEQARLEKMQEKDSGKSGMRAFATCSNGHRLNATVVKDLTEQHNGYDKGYQCHYCKKLYLNGEKSFHCQRCFYDLCKDCHNKALSNEIQTIAVAGKKKTVKKEEKKEETKENKDDNKDDNKEEAKDNVVRCEDGHEFTQHKSTEEGYSCDECHREFDSKKAAYICTDENEENQIYNCKDCYKDKEMFVARKANIEVRCGNGHKLWSCSGAELKKMDWEDDYQCSMCEEDIARRKGANICFDEQCEFAMCNKCYQNEKSMIEKDYKKLSKGGMKEEDYVMASYYAVCGCGHQLISMNGKELRKENEGYSNGFGCDECGSHFDLTGNTVSYHCGREEGYDLCENCFNQRIADGHKKANGEDGDDGSDEEVDDEVKDVNDIDEVDNPEAKAMYESIVKGTISCDVCGEGVLKSCKFDGQCHGCGDGKPKKSCSRGFECNSCNVSLCEYCGNSMKCSNVAQLSKVSETLAKQAIDEARIDINTQDGQGRTILYQVWESHDASYDDDEQLRQKVLRFLVNNGGYCGNYQSDKVDDDNKAETKDDNQDGDDDDEDGGDYDDGEDEDGSSENENDSESESENEDGNDNDQAAKDLEKHQAKEKQYVDEFRQGIENVGQLTMLHWLCLDSNDLLHIKKLIENGSSVAIPNQQGFTCIYYAIFNGDIEFVKFLCYVLTTKVKNVGKLKALLKLKESIVVAKTRRYNDLKQFLTTLQSALKSGGASLDSVRSMIGDSGQLSKEKITIKYLDIERQEKEALLLMSELDTTSKISIVESVMHLLKTKQIFSQDWLMFSFYYLQSIGDKKRLHKLIELIKKTVRTALTVSNPCKKRDHLWFKKYLLSSNVWFIKNEENGSLLFDDICKVVDEELIAQQKFLKNKFLTLINDAQDGKFFKELLTYKEWTDKSQSGKGGLRQDAIDGGVEAQVKKSSLFVSRDTGFDARQEYDLNIYLTTVLLRGHSVNDQFQSDMKDVFTKTIKCGKFSKAPVKLAERCQIKASTDYATRAWPTTSAIVDIIRCSISFDSAKEMIESMTTFLKMVESGKCGCVKKIIRVKNMFSQFGDKDIKDIALNKFSYCDIKFNCIILVRGQAIVGEIQFLLNFMTEAKKMGHSLYGIVRQREFVDDVTALMKKKSSKSANDLVSNLIVENDFASFSTEMIINPRRMVYLSGNDNNDKPMLYSLLKSDWKPAIELYCHSMLHFDTINQFNRKFIEKYLQHPSLKEFENHEAVKKLNSIVQDTV